MCCVGASAQEKLFNSASVQSPVINSDGTVTFNLFAPKASKVELVTSCPPSRSRFLAMASMMPQVWLS